jgi:nicotinamidase-related amidase
MTNYAEVTSSNESFFFESHYKATQPSQLPLITNCIIPAQPSKMSTSNQQPSTALLLIDIQDGFTHPTHWGPSRSNLSFEANIKSLLPIYRELISSTTSRTQTSPHKIIHVAHASKSAQSTLHPSKPGFAFQSFATPLSDELVIAKNVNSAFIGTDLENLLRQHFDGAPGTLWVVGLTTDHCVSTSVRMAGNLGVCDGLDGEKGYVILVGYSLLEEE